MYNLNWLDGQSIYAKLEADHFVFDRNDVTFDFSYGLYELGNMTLEQAKKGYCRVPSKEEIENIFKYFDFNLEEYLV